MKKEMIRIVRVAAAAVFMTWCGGRAVEADVVKLKTGRIVEGNILEETADLVKIDFNGVTLKFYRDEISSIEKGSVPQGMPSPETDTAEIKPDKGALPPPPAVKREESMQPPNFSQQDTTSAGEIDDIARPTTGQFKVFDAILDQQQADMQRVLEEQKERINQIERQNQEYYDNLLEGNVE